MSFKFEWGPFTDSDYEKAKKAIQEGLNKGNKPSSIADTIYVEKLDFGTKVFFFFFEMKKLNQNLKLLKKIAS